MCLPRVSLLGLNWSEIPIGGFCANISLLIISNRKPPHSVGWNEWTLYRRWTLRKVKVEDRKKVDRKRFEYSMNFSGVLRRSTSIIISFTVENGKRRKVEIPRWEKFSGKILPSRSLTLKRLLFSVKAFTHFITVIFA